MKILVFNAGSSTQKSCLYEIENGIPERPLQPLWEASADWTHAHDVAELTIKTAQGQGLEERLPATARSAVIERMLKSLWSGPTQVITQPDDIAVVGHRVVHGGPEYRQSTVITPEVKKTVRELFAFAPLHNPANLEGVEIAERFLGKVPQIAVFDTAFHSQLPPEVTTYPGPYAWLKMGIRRYGFHGISHQYCAGRSAQLLGKRLETLRIINCHLGNGCSLAAIKGGHSIDTTMGFTPLEGLMMGSRSGSIDPGILLYLQREQGYSSEQIDYILNKESGLKGISGFSSDMRQILQAIHEGHEQAQLALEIYIYRLRYFMGAMLASMGAVDVIIFTGGVGENVPQIRAEACAAFGFLNLKLDTVKNAVSPSDQDIATADSTVRVLIVHTEEDWEIAKECWYLQQG